MGRAGAAGGKNAGATGAARSPQKMCVPDWAGPDCGSAALKEDSRGFGLSLSRPYAATRSSQAAPAPGSHSTLTCPACTIARTSQSTTSPSIVSSHRCRRPHDLANGLRHAGSWHCAMSHLLMTPMPSRERPGETIPRHSLRHSSRPAGGASVLRCDPAPATLLTSNIDARLGRLLSRRADPVRSRCACGIFNTPVKPAVVSPPLCHVSHVSHVSMLFSHRALPSHAFQKSRIRALSLALTSEPQASRGGALVCVSLHRHPSRGHDVASERTLLQLTLGAPRPHAVVQQRPTPRKPRRSFNSIRW